ECTVLMWCNSLLNHSLAYIQLVHASSPCPLPIYNLSFVAAALASGSGVTAKPVVYIIKDRIPGDWQKYIVNSTAIPLISKDDPEYYRALFMSFIQHVQFEKTDGLAFISDWQGVGNLLSDLQLMTHPLKLAAMHEALSTESALNLYGDGNLPAAFMRFPEEHICNEYCTWAGLP
ncbi:hypothetical protein C8J55DRAFT_408662, partial [Lentinula edodes]